VRLGRSSPYATRSEETRVGIEETATGIEETTV
jgi:hypothetical protein